MLRTQIYLDDALNRQLRAVAAADGRSAAAVIREALRRYFADRTTPGDVADPILALAGTFKGLPSDAAAEHDRDLYGAAAGQASRRR